ncbi:hypothetical protein B0H10DRAFT_2217693 [Mycena sp. CBHHK59/15]|nr:hypothetical protein B0H10DRAFT_2217693 [Mycena sp. CBHHK59/15]
MLPAHEGQHAIRWFIHDPWDMFTKAAEMEIPNSWINSALAGLEWVNPFIAELEKLNVYDDDDDIALQIELSNCISNEIAAVISLAPASLPSRRKLVIRRKGADEPICLLLLPHGTLGWSPRDMPTPSKTERAAAALRRDRHESFHAALIQKLFAFSP